VWGVIKPETGSRFATLWPSSWKIDMTSYVCRGSSNSNKIWQGDAESYADDGEKVEIEPVCKISIRPPFVSETGSGNVSAVDWGMSSKVGTQIGFTFSNVRRHQTGTASRFSTLRRHLGKSIWRHHSIADGLVRIEFGRPIQKVFVFQLWTEEVKPQTEM